MPVILKLFIPEAVRFLCRSSSCREPSALLDDDGVSLSLIRDRRLTEPLKEVSCGATETDPLGPVGGLPSCDSRRSRLEDEGTDSAFCRFWSLLGPEGALGIAFGPSGSFFSGS